MTTMWGDSDPKEVKRVWGDELRPYDAYEVRRALDAMRLTFLEFPPSLFQFAALCRDVRAVRTMLQLPTPAPRGPIDPVVLAKIRALTERMRHGQPDKRKWARDIMAEAAAGTYHYAIGIEIAKRVLGLDQPAIDAEAIAERLALQTEDQPV